MMGYRERKEMHSWKGGEVGRTSEDMNEKKPMIKINYIKGFIFNKKETESLIEAITML